MTDIVSVLMSQHTLHYEGAVGAKEIADTEAALGTEFSEEYRTYLSVFGEASYYGHELTGICDHEPLHVAAVTKEERNYADAATMNWYVIEQAHIDGIVIWQSTGGAIYQTSPNQMPVQIASSLAEYIMRY